MTRALVLGILLLASVAGAEEAEEAPCAGKTKASDRCVKSAVKAARKWVRAVGAKNANVLLEMLEPPTTVFYEPIDGTPSACQKKFRTGVALDSATTDSLVACFGRRVKEQGFSMSRTGKASLVGDWPEAKPWQETVDKALVVEIYEEDDCSRASIFLAMVGDPGTGWRVRSSLFAFYPKACEGP
jgi:hypothetical protein